MAHGGHSGGGGHYHHHYRSGSGREATWGEIFLSFGIVAALVIFLQLLQPPAFLVSNLLKGNMKLIRLM